MPPTQSHNWGEFQNRAKGFEARCNACHKIARFPASLKEEKQGKCPGHPAENGCDHMTPSKRVSNIIEIGRSGQRCFGCGREWYPDSPRPNEYMSVEPQGRPVRIPMYTETGATWASPQTELPLGPTETVVTASLDYINAYYKVNYTHAEWELIDPQGYLRIAAAGDQRTSRNAFQFINKLCRSARVRWKKRFTPKPTARQLHPKIPVVKTATGRRRKQLIEQ